MQKSSSNDKPQSPKKKTRVIVKPLEPLKPPSRITERKIREFVKAVKPKLKGVLYMGWVRRNYLVQDMEGNIAASPRKAMRYFASTADSAKEARELHKKSFKMGVEVWDLT